jgi:hypothetical protein
VHHTLPAHSHRVHMRWSHQTAAVSCECRTHALFKAAARQGEHHTALVVAPPDSTTSPARSTTPEQTCCDADQVPLLRTQPVLLQIVALSRLAAADASLKQG